MEPPTRTLAPITSTNEAKASMSTASSTASRTSDSPSKSPLWRLPPDVLTNLQPSYWTRLSSHGPPDGGPAGAVPPAGFVLGRREFPVQLYREFYRKVLIYLIILYQNGGCRGHIDRIPGFDRKNREFY